MLQNILITGGGSGIGLELVKRFLNNNDNVFTISRNIDNLTAIAKNHGERLTIIQGDITVGSSRENIINSMSQISKINIINNAAYGMPELFRSSNLEQIKQHFETNFFAPIELIQSILNTHIVPKVLNISSGAAQTPLQSLFGYCTSKSAVHHAMQCLNLEYPDTMFTNLRPGLVNTPLQQRWRSVDPKIFPNGNFYKKAESENILIPINIAVDFIFWAFSQDVSKLEQKDWNIYDNEHHRHWLNTQCLFG